MAGRGPQSYKKRQKEQKRKERQDEKRAKRIQRKLDGPLPDEDTQPEGLPLEGDVQPEGLPLEEAAQKVPVGTEQVQDS